MSCNTKTLYKSLKHCPGQRVSSGVRATCYFASVRDIVKWPTLPEIGQDADSKKLSTYEGNFTLAADKKWMRIDLVPDKGNVECDVEGEDYSRLYLNKFTAQHPGTDEDATAFARQALLDRFVFLIQQRNGKFRVLGCEEYQGCDVKTKLATGEGKAGAGTSIEIQANDFVPAPFYTGEIVTEEGKIGAGATTTVPGIGG